MHCNTCQGKTASLLLFCAALQNSIQHACATAITLVEICSSEKCAVMQHQSTATLVKAKQLPCCCSVLLCKTAYSMLVQLQLHLWRFGLPPGVQ
jgi:hypothetical protein